MVPLLLRIRSQLGSWPASEKEFGEQISSVTASSTDTAMAKFLEPILSEPRLLQQISAGPIPPCAAVVGGLLGQEVVKVVTRRDEPLVNTGIPDSYYRQLSHTFLPEGAALPPNGEYGVGNVFLPQEENRRLDCTARFDRLAGRFGLRVLGWRWPLEVRSGLLGPASRGSEPFIAQVFVGRANGEENLEGGSETEGRVVTEEGGALSIGPAGRWQRGFRIYVMRLVQDDERYLSAA
ncbi:hypothetical protein FOZ63_021871, partial [Perkinsus olseni]